MGKNDFHALEARLGHQFARPGLLEQALTHPSIGGRARPDNQRLEFLGDRVLGLCMAEALIHRYPEEAEGMLSPRLHALVSREACAAAARRIDLGGHLRMGRSEAISGGRRKHAVLADAMEAVIAAVYLDAGMPTARDVVLSLWAEALKAQNDAPQNPKTALQEWAQARGLPPPDYAEVRRSGPDHAPVFIVRVVLENGRAAEAAAASKRAGERAAAAALLKELEAEA